MLLLLSYFYQIIKLQHFSRGISSDDKQSNMSWVVLEMSAWLSSHPCWWEMKLDQIRRGRGTGQWTDEESPLLWPPHHTSSFQSSLPTQLLWDPVFFWSQNDAHKVEEL